MNPPKILTANNQTRYTARGALLVEHMHFTQLPERRAILSTSFRDITCENIGATGFIYVEERKIMMPIGVWPKKKNLQAQNISRGQPETGV
jgi:hypothetical protein